MHIPFPKNEFDAVCSNSVLHHIDDFGRAVGEAHRTVRPGGFVFAFDPNLFHPCNGAVSASGQLVLFAQGRQPQRLPVASR